MSSDAIPIIPIGLGLEDDADVYDAVKRLALHTVDVAIEILDEAAPAQQLQMIRILLPRLTGTLSRGGADENEELRASVQQMYDAISAALPGGDDNGSS